MSRARKGHVEYGTGALTPSEGVIGLVTRYIVHNGAVNIGITGICEEPSCSKFADASDDCSNNKDTENHRNHNYQCAIKVSSQYISTEQIQCDNSPNGRGLSEMAIAAVVIACHMDVLSAQRARSSVMNVLLTLGFNSNFPG